MSKSDWSALTATVAKLLKSGRVGTPVSARAFVHLDGNAAALESRLCQVVAFVSECIPGKLEGISISGNIARSQLTAFLRFARGESALVSVGVRHAEHPLFEFTLIGNRGVANWKSSGAINQHHEDPPDPDSALLRSIRLATVSGDLVRGGIAVNSGPLDLGRAHGGPLAAPSPEKLSPPFGVLLISGDQTHQENYYPLFLADGRCRLIGISDMQEITPRRRALNQSFAERLKIPYLEPLEVALARDDVHVVCVCAEPERRAAIIAQSLAANKHVYLDKPLCGSVDEAGALELAAAKSPGVTQMFSFVNSDWARQAREVIQNRTIGELLAIHCDQLFAKGAGGTARLGTPRRESLRPDRFEALESKREMTNVGIYGIFLIEWLTARSPRRIDARTGNFFFQEHQKNDMEDFGQIVMELEGGMTASVTAGRTGWKTHPQAGLQRIVLVGSKANVVIDCSAPRLEVWADEPPWQPPETPHPEDPMGMWTGTQLASGVKPKTTWMVSGDASQADVQNFLNCVERGEPSSGSLAVAANAQRTLLAAYQSAAQGTVLRIDG